MIMKQLNEKADGVINSKGDYLWSSNTDSIPLFYDKKINKVFVGNKGETHLRKLFQESPRSLDVGVCQIVHRKVKLIKKELN